MIRELVEELGSIVGPKWVVFKREDLADYLTDETAPTVHPEPAEKVVLVRPATSEEVSRILKYAHSRRIPVFPRGGGTGLVGGSVPTENGVILSLERMNQVVEVDPQNLMVTVKAGVTLEQLTRTADEAGLSFPLHPGDEAAHVGGLVACNAGGARAVKHGVMRNYVKGIEVVLPTGEILTLRGKLLKDVAGYDLMHLIIGSEGTLGVITKATLRLYPKSEEAATLVVPYANRFDALTTVPEILQAGMTPLAIEYVEQELMKESARQIGKTWPVSQGNVCLILVITGKHKEEVYNDASRIDQIAKKHHAIDTLVVQNKRKQDEILAIRSKIYLFLKPDTMDIVDIAVPPASIVRLMNTFDKIAERYSMRLPTFGHVGDGNLHTHILMKEAGGIERSSLQRVKREIYDACRDLGGSITAEHGIGKIRTANLLEHADRRVMDLMKQIKRAFDPHLILNPGTVIASAS